MEEDYVTFEQAKKLKELGFDWYGECFYKYYYSPQLDQEPLFACYSMDDIYFREDDRRSPEKAEIYLAPSLSQAAKWLREKGLIINITYKPVYYYGDIYNEAKDDYEYVITENFDTYESVLSAMIDRVLELLK